MRFVPVNCIKEGMITGKRLIGRNGELLLNSGSPILQSYIDKIKELGYNGIYIDDPLSDGIEVSGVISDDLKNKTVKTVKNSFLMLEKSGANASGGIKSIENLLQAIIEEMSGNTDVLVNMIDLKVFDDYTYYHSTNVAVLSLVIGFALNLKKNLLYKLGLAALLHDIGKVFVPKEILNKPSKLTVEEFDQIKMHSEKGYAYLKDKFNIPSISYNGVLQHHERYDGSGYPEGIGGDNISLFARIIAVADVYDALTSLRSYRKALPPSEAVEYLMGSGGFLFDMKITECFVKRIAPYPAGTCVRLSNGSTGIVVENFTDNCLRPIIKVVTQGGKQVEPYILDLKNDMGALGITVLGFEDEPGI